MGITLKELAAEVGVSFQVVSEVLNRKQTRKVAPETRQRIEEAAERAGYRPNRAAKSLRKNKQYTIGITMPIGAHFYGVMASLLQRELNLRGYITLFSFWNSHEDQEKAYENILNHGVDGIISWPTQKDYITREFPMVLFEKKLPDIDSVMLDADSISSTGVEYLYELGHRRFAYVGACGDPRLNAMCRSLEKHGLSLASDCVCGIISSVENGYLGMKQILETAAQLPSALLTLDDYTACGAIAAIQDAGLSVPRDISVIGFNNSEEGRYLSPHLTTFDDKNEEIAKELVRLLFFRLNHPSAPPERVVIHPEIILRKSCAKANLENLNLRRSTE